MNLHHGTFVLAALVASFAVLAVTACGGYGDDPTPTPAGKGTLSGTVSIGPLCPVEPCQDPVNPYPGLKVVLTRDGEEAAMIDVQEDGTFSGQVPAGEFQLTVEPCQWLGCMNALPVQVRVRDGEVSSVAVVIDTGIR